MFENPYAASLDTQILSATPLELVRMLYDAAIDSTQAARRHLAQGRIAERTRAVTKAFDILAELYGSLDRERGGELSVRLGGLYDYMQRRLLDANFEQSDDGLAEVEGLLSSLREAWRSIDAQPVKATPVAEPILSSYTSNRYSSYELEPTTATTHWSA